MKRASGNKRSSLAKRAAPPPKRGKVQRGKAERAEDDDDGFFLGEDEDGRKQAEEEEEEQEPEETADQLRLRLGEQHGWAKQYGAVRVCCFRFDASGFPGMLAAAKPAADWSSFRAVSLQPLLPVGHRAARSSRNHADAALDGVGVCMSLARAPVRVHPSRDEFHLACFTCCRRWRDPQPVNTWRSWVPRTTTSRGPLAA